MRSSTHVGRFADVKMRAQVGVSTADSVSTCRERRRQLAKSSKSHHTGSVPPSRVWKSIATSSLPMLAAGTDDSNEIQSDSPPRLLPQANCLSETAPGSPRQLS